MSAQMQHITYKEFLPVLLGTRVSVKVWESIKRMEGHVGIGMDVRNI